MKISQKLEYACRALVQLSKGYDGKTLTRLDDLAQREAVSSNFLVQILNDLRRAGLIDSRRGASGGYLLSREPDKINMRQIVDAVEPAQLINTAVDQGESGSGVKQVWEDISVKLTKDLEKITLDSFSETQTMPDFSI
ncbi:RrF2 family transcriptional regulator [Luteolibacter sp. AS25]|uniref:RrF2 family transcriptional regulator n=1 Tax=Luteolibacter sp. AS25 TaxID=3135776 RepID=UPI00398AA527